jgi:hypothetical protein
VACSWGVKPTDESTSTTCSRLGLVAACTFLSAATKSTMLAVDSAGQGRQAGGQMEVKGRKRHDEAVKQSGQGV